MPWLHPFVEPRLIKSMLLRDGYVVFREDMFPPYRPRASEGHTVCYSWR